MQKQEKTKKAILDAADHEFMKKGFDGARTIEIANRANISHGMLHYYFRNKEQLFEFVLERRIIQMREILLRLNIDDNIKHANLIDQICHMVGLHFDYISQNEGLTAIIMGSMTEDSTYLPFIKKNIQSAKNELFIGLQANLSDAILHGEIRLIDTNALFLDIITFNIFSVILYKKINLIGLDFYNSYEEYCSARRAEIIELIRLRLTPYK